MTFSRPTPLAARWRGISVALAAAGLALAASAQTAPSPAADANGLPVIEAASGRLAVGDATNGLLALQRGGSLAPADAHPIDGQVATRSYQRYLKSFEHPIPEHYDSTTGGSATGSGNTSH